MKGNSGKLIWTIILVAIIAASAYIALGGSIGGGGIPGIGSNKLIICEVTVKNDLLSDTAITNAYCSTSTCLITMSDPLSIFPDDDNSLQLIAGAKRSEKSFRIDEGATQQHKLSICAQKEVTTATLNLLNNNGEIIESREVTV